MKKYLIIGILALMGVVMTSCDKQEYHSRAFNLTVMQADWKWDAQTEQFYYSFNLPYLTQDVYDFGTITISREFNPNTKDAYQVALPMSTYLYENLIDTVTGEVSTVYYTQHIDYRYGVGYVDIQLTNSDYYYEAQNPESMLFRLQMVY